MAMIILLGGNGYIGSAYRRYLQDRGLAFTAPGRKQLDGADSAQLAHFLHQNKAEFLINAAGYTGKPNVDACEDNKAACLLGNAVLPGMVARACAEVGIPWGHVSSGCLYSGRRADGRGFTEDDPPNFSFRQNNCSFYSGCKALGEEVLSSAPQCYVWRLRIPFDEIDGARNYLSKLMRYEKLLNVENSLSHLGDFVRATVQSWQEKLSYGTYNITNPGSVTTREVVEIIRASGVRQWEPQFFASEEAFMRTAAKAPRSSCVLDSSKITGAGIELTPVREAIGKALQNWRPEAPTANAIKK